MISRRNLFGLTLAVVGMAFLAADATQAMAQSGGNRVRLEARMSGGGAQSKARYEERTARPNRRKFTFELEKGTAGTVITVKHNGSDLGTRTIDAFGNAKIDVDTNEGDAVGAMAAGDEISVWVGGVQVMSGNLR